MKKIYIQPSAFLYHMNIKENISSSGSCTQGYWEWIESSGVKTFQDNASSHNALSVPASCYHAGLLNSYNIIFE